MTRSTEIEIKVGIFVALGIALIMLTVLLLGGGQSLFQRSVFFHTKFGQIEGLVEGAAVKMAGVRVGQVSNIQLLKDSSQVDVVFSVANRFKDAVRQDSTVAIHTQGVLGDRFIVILPSGPNSPLAIPASELRSEPPKELKDYLNNADEVLDRLKNSLAHMESILNSFQREGRAETFFRNITGFSSNVNDGTKNLRESMSHLKSIMTKVDNGQGTIGALINDASLYDDVKTLIGGANRSRVLKYFIRKSVEESREADRKSEEQKKK